MIEPTNQTGSNSANLLQMIEKIKQNSRIAAQVDYKQELLHGICTSMHWSIQSIFTTKNGRFGHGWRMVAYWTDLSMNLQCRCNLPKEGNRHGWLRSQAGLYTGSCDWCLAVKFHAGRWKEDARIWRPNPSHICVQELRTTGVRSTEMGVRWGNKGSCQWGACFFPLWASSKNTCKRFPCSSSEAACVFYGGPPREAAWWVGAEALPKWGSMLSQRMVSFCFFPKLSVHMHFMQWLVL